MGSKTEIVSSPILLDSSSSSSEEEETNFIALQLINHAPVLQASLKTAVELDLFELMKNAGDGGFVSPAELAALIQATNPEAHIMLDRILRLLASYNILNCIVRNLPDNDGGVERLYSLAPICKFFTKDDDGVSMAPMLLLTQDRIFRETWCHLKDAILEGGIPFNRAFGMSLYEYTGRDPRLNKVFNQAMSQQSTIIMKKILENYNGFEGLKTLVDVGGGIGSSLNLITSKYPSIRGINFDLPHVIQDAPSYSGVEHIGGDMFVSVPTGGTIFMKSICHNWDDEHCLKILKNCYEALPTYGKVIIVERILSEVPNKDLAAVGFHMDVIMLAQNPGGKERTEREFQVLAKKIGFREFHKVCRAYSMWIMEFHK